MSDDKENLKYRPNVCLVILNQNNQIFIGERNNSDGLWQLPQGGVEAEFSLEENALREAYEELGAEPESFEIIKQLNAEHKYDFRNPPDYAIGVFRGQEQTFWLIRYTGNDQEIDLNRHHPEFQNWTWCAVEQLLAQTDPVRHDGYQKFLKELKEFIANEQ